jgi:hypothetical protein
LRVAERASEKIPTMNKVKVLNGVSRYFLGFAFFEYSFVAANLYYDPAFNLGQVGAVDPIIEGMTNDEVYTLYTSIPNERARRITLWNLLFVRVGAIMQSAWGFAMMWAVVALPFKDRYPFHFIYCWVAFWMAHIDFSYGYGVEVGANTLEKYGYEPMASRLMNMPFMVFLLLVHGTLAALSVLAKKSDSEKSDSAETPVEKVAVAEDVETPVP